MTRILDTSAKLACPHRQGAMCLSRREMLFASSAGAMTLLLGELFP